jgi:hypothetical protein
MRPTIKTLIIEAKALNIVRRKNSDYWHYKGENALITHSKLLKILGYTFSGEVDEFGNEIEFNSCI